MTSVVQKKRGRQESQKRFREAEKSLRKMQEELRPFIRPRKIETYTSAGRWIETSSLELVDT